MFDWQYVWSLRHQCVSFYQDDENEDRVGAEQEKWLKFEPGLKNVQAAPNMSFIVFHTRVRGVYRMLSIHGFVETITTDSGFKDDDLFEQGVIEAWLEPKWPMTFLGSFYSTFIGGGYSSCHHDI